MSCITCRQPQHLCSKCPCPHEEVIVDDVYCREPCNVRHSFCLDCGDPMEGCVYD